MPPVQTTNPRLAALFAALLCSCAERLDDDEDVASTGVTQLPQEGTESPPPTGCVERDDQVEIGPGDDQALADYCAAYVPGPDDTGGIPEPPYPTLDLSQCEWFCPPPDTFEEVTDCEIVAVTDNCSAFTVDCHYAACETPGEVGGRMHEVICSRPEGARSLGTWLAAVAHNEAASVHSFEALARELRGLGAPDQLIARAHAARDDEVRHATLMTRLARSEGPTPPDPQVAETLPHRTLLAIAIENAVEGCVHETWAALEAHHQALHAPDARLRSAMRTIAEDETRHAQLAWDIDEWCRGRLSAAEYAQVEQARRAAARARLAHSQVVRGFEREAGLPAPRVARRLSLGLYGQLWAA